MDFFLKRFLLNAADAAPSGGGANPTPSPQPEPPAQTVAAPVTIDDATLSRITNSVRDGIFAELRRSGALPDKKQPKATTDSPVPANAAPASADPIKLRALDRALVRAGRALNESAYARIERDFVADAPADVDSWLGDYFVGFGAGAAGSTTSQQGAGLAPTTTDTKTTRTTVPVSDGGSPPAPKVPLEEQDILSLSQADREHLLKTKGAKWYRETLARQSKGRSVKLR